MIKVGVKIMGKSWGNHGKMISLHILKFYHILLIRYPTLPLQLFVLCFLPIL